MTIYAVYRIRKDCPQCRRKVNPKQIYRVILSFESCDTIKFPEVVEQTDKSLLEKLEIQKGRLEDLEQQIKSKE